MHFYSAFIIPTAIIPGHKMILYIDMTGDYLKVTNCYSIQICGKLWPQF